MQLIDNRLSITFDYRALKAYTTFAALSFIQYESLYAWISACAALVI
jgi:hypothetical protein